MWPTLWASVAMSTQRPVDTFYVILDCTCRLVALYWVWKPGLNRCRMKMKRIMARNLGHHRPPKELLLELAGHAGRGLGLRSPSLVLASSEN